MTTRIDAAKKELLNSRWNLEEAEKNLEEQKTLYKEVQGKYRDVISAFREQLDKNKDSLLADCYLDKTRDLIMQGVIIKLHTLPKYEENYTYVFPFKTLSSGLADGRGARYCPPESHHEITVNCRDKTIFESIEASIARSGTIIEFPESCANRGAAAGWIRGLLYAIAYYYWKNHSSGSDCLRDSILFAKALIEQHPEFAKDGYENSLIEYLYCYDAEKAT